MNRRTFIAAAIVTLPALGCGGGRGSLKGTVAYKKKLLNYGTVSAVGSDGVVSYCEITPESTYSFDSLPNGKVKLAVESRQPEGGKSTAGSDEPGARLPLPGRTTAAAPTNAKAWFAIPEHFGRFDESGLTADVSGSTTFDIEMTA